MEPFTSWTCDRCGDEIVDPGMGLVTWRQRERPDRGYISSDFLVVHKNAEGRNCDPGAAGGYEPSLDISEFLGDVGQARLLSMLSAGPLIGDGHCEIERGDMDAFVDLFRRMQTPFYEQARKRWRDEDVQHWLGDTSEVYPYDPDVLRRVVEGTLGQ